MGIINFLIDTVEAIIDIGDTWREKNEGLAAKLITIIITLVFLIISAKMWL